MTDGSVSFVGLVRDCLLHSALCPHKGGGRLDDVTGTSAGLLRKKKHTYIQRELASLVPST